MLSDWFGALKIQLPKYSFKAFAGDCSGGLVAALIALPYGLAMASVMGLPPVLGLFTSLISAPMTAFFGRNPVLIGGTSSVTLPFLIAAVMKQGVGGAAKVTLVAAVFLMMFSTLRLGRFASKVPHTVVSGFSCGIGAMMVITQLKTIFGVSLPASSVLDSMMVQFIAILGQLGSMKWQPFVLGLAVVLVSFVVAKWNNRMPAPLIGVFAAIGISLALNLHEKEVGRLPLELPPFAGFQWSARDVFEVLPAGFGLAFVTAINVLITGRVVDHFRGRHSVMKPADADKELGAYGIANICAGIFGAPMSVGIPARSLANVRCGGTTRMSNIIHALILLACLWLGSEYVSHIPLAALAGVTAYIGICLLEWGTWRRLPRMSRLDAAAFLGTAIGVLVMNAVYAVALGCSVYILRGLWHRFHTPAAPAAVLPAQSDILASK
jgi:sulfate permease, SulP family